MRHAVGMPLRLYLIEILHQTTTRVQLVRFPLVLYLIEILHQTTTARPAGLRFSCCILLKFYIKPQQRSSPMEISAVVSYWNSTSNHNMRHAVGMPLRLYLIEILHQTTTRVQLVRFPLVLYLIEILHQTTTARPAGLRFSCCILLKFYIKPQLSWLYASPFCVVSYWNSTSNHNWTAAILAIGMLYLIEILHQTTTSTIGGRYPKGCILLKFYIKPQQREAQRGLIQVVSYWNSTSNHNSWIGRKRFPSLYLIEILHQTTTCGKCEDCLRRCILLKFYIKPQQRCCFNVRGFGCILLKFYIKPQQLNWEKEVPVVVSYWNSTSNHNGGSRYSDWLEVVSYWNSTSNHNPRSPILQQLMVVSYWNSTSNHNPGGMFRFWTGVVSYWNSTSNHNNTGSGALNRHVVSYWNSTSNHNNTGGGALNRHVVSYWNSTSIHNYSEVT